MNEFHKRMMDAPSIVSDDGMCVICRIRRAQNRHHIVYRSQGGTDGPTADVCGYGNASGCHGMLHMHLLHLRFEDGEWQVLQTNEPTKYDAALRMRGWRRL